MAIDPTIALSIRPPQFDMPLNGLARMLQLEGAQQTNALNTMKMDEYRAGAQEKNALRDLYAQPGFDPGTPDGLQRVMRVSPTQGLAMQKAALEAEEKRSKIGKEKIDALDKSLGMFRSFVPTVQSPEGVAAYVTALYNHPELGALAKQFGTLEGSIAANQQLYAADPKKWAASVSGMSAEKLLETLKGTRQNVNLGNVNQGSAVDYYGNVIPGSVTTSPIGQSSDNKATVGASLANAAATRDAAKTQADATRDAANAKRDQDTEMKLADDYRAQSKDFGASTAAHKQLKATLASATTSPAATLAAATKFMKILDPGSVVRESELGMALAASGVIDRAQNYINILQRGKVLTETQAKDFADISEKMYSAAQQVQRSIDADYTKKAKAYKLRPEMVTQDLGQNDGSVPPAVAAALAKHRDK